MRVFVVDNTHIVKDCNGIFYSPTIYDYNFLKRYLSVFDVVRFIGKVKYQDHVDKTKYRVLSGPGVEIIELPWYQGLREMLSKTTSLFRIYRNSCEDCDCLIFRVVQIESILVYLLGQYKNKPYALEVVNDPDTFVDMPDIMRIFSVHMLKRMMKKAVGASYVTKSFLQKKYPVGKCSLFESYYSSISLSDSSIAKDPIAYVEGTTFRIIHVSNAINTDVKGHYTLIKMAKILSDHGMNFDVTCIGDGTKIEEYETYINKIGVSDKVHFIGRITDKVRLLELLQKSNLMVLPTKMEGLPRTIIEAMAVGLPCLSTPIAGIPELLDEKYLFDSDDYEGFAKEVERLMVNTEELLSMSKNNIIKASEFSETILEKRRIAFYSDLRKCASNR